MKGQPGPSPRARPRLGRCGRGTHPNGWPLPPLHLPQDLDSGHYGSGFPLPEWRRKLLAAHLGKPGAPAELPPYGSEAEKEYAEHPWNINNMPRSKDSVLR